MNDHTVHHDLGEIPRIAATGPIVGVVVHGRGAVITRRIDVEGPVPSTSFDLCIGQITPLADPGSVRVSLPDESRTLVGVNARIEVPSTDSGPGPSTELVERLNRRIDRLHEREAALKERAKRLQNAVLTPSGGKALREAGAANRVAAALELSEVISSTVASIDERIADLRLEIQRATQERDAAHLEDLQTSGSDRMGDGHPTRAFDLRIAAGAANIQSLELSYAVPYAAKWWPRYTLRLTHAGTRATLAIEALVAQRTGEDWTNVPIGLSTAAIVFDATLPRLPSLRLGKRQPTESRGFREPPGGVDRLFESYDGFRGRQKIPQQTASPSRVTRSEVTAVMSHQSAYAYDSPHELDDITGNVQEEIAEALDMAPRAPARSPQPQMGHAPAPSAPQPARARSAPTGSSASFKQQAFTPPAFGGDASSYGGGGPGGPAPPQQAPASHDPGDNWLEFDALVLAGRDARARGRLQRRQPPGGLPESELFDAQESARRMSLVDPSVSRGLFDYRYDAVGSVRIPADGRLHRIEVLEQTAASRLHWRTVPLVDPAVYREAVLENPFSSPLLAGPVDVFSEGQLVTTTDVERVDAGGSMRVGLGVDERIRVSRNVRMAEESAGLLGGKRELIHDVEIELRSGLGEPATVEVIDRIPVTNDNQVEIELLHETPAGEAYEQKELDHPIKGGRRWTIKLGAGGRAKVDVRYQVTLRSKDELMGGNRRA